MTKIEWTEETINTVTGCHKISDGCKNCYAEKMHRRLCAMGSVKYQHLFNKVLCFDPKVELNKMKKNTKYCFVNSMSDTFNSEVSDQYINDLLSELSRYKNTIFQILTKRAERLPDFNYPQNVWVGVTVENEENKKRIEFLKKTDAKIKFLSCEPLLSDLGELELSGIDWVIVGGETGFNARPMRAEWVRNIQRQCKQQHVAFFFKQWGEWCSAEQLDFDTIQKKFILHKMADNSFCILNCEIKENYGYKVGKKYAGCKLDGIEYKEFPVCG